LGISRQALKKPGTGESAGLGCVDGIPGMHF
jgi:hypothetical protein